MRANASSVCCGGRRASGRRSPRTSSKSAARATLSSVRTVGVRVPVSILASVGCEGADAFREPSLGYPGELPRDQNQEAGADRVWGGAVIAVGLILIPISVVVWKIVALVRCLVRHR
jgi:hypothetical protein